MEPVTSYETKDVTCYNKCWLPLGILAGSAMFLFSEWMTEYVRLCELILWIFMISLIHIYHVLEGLALQHASVCGASHLVMNIYQHSSRNRSPGTILGRPINTTRAKAKINSLFIAHQWARIFPPNTRSSLLSHKEKVTAEGDDGSLPL